MSAPVLSIEHLTVDYEVGAGTFHALADVSLEIETGHVVGIVGETGCGKSTLAQAIPRLLPEPPAKYRSGKILFQGTDLVTFPRWKFPTIRGTGIGMIFQEPLNSLNPAFRVYDQLVEAVRIRQAREAGRRMMRRDDGAPYDYARPTESPGAGAVLSKVVVPPTAADAAMQRTARARPDLREEVLDSLRLVRINDPETILGLYPHELSGGMRQRIMIAMALSEKPSLLIADEPTSALDVTIQAQVLTLMKELIDEVHASILFISHDLGVIAETADEVGVMYAGHLVEFGPVAEVYAHPSHPYTKALLRAAPRRYKSDGPLDSIAGSVPNLSHPPTGCAFHPRCPLARPRCRDPPGPPLDPAPGRLPNHRSACYYAEEVASLP
jgi:peptide/nickel transport system ATP-binding protein